MRRNDIDVLKAVAIVAVMLYHFGFSTYGYLGVDLFLVINGFLITSSLIHNTRNATIGYVDFLVKRFCRLYPLVLLAGLVSMALGAISMLPDNYENVAMSVVASNLFSNNVLAAITTGNYWDVVNNYKPLMHTWYLGIVAAFYLIYPLLFILPQKLLKNTDKTVVLKRVAMIVLVCSLVSLGLYLVPSIQYSTKFYYLPFRFYELGFGGIVAFLYGKRPQGLTGRVLNIASLLALTALMFINVPFMNDSLRLLLVVGLSCVACYTYSAFSETKDPYKGLSFVGVLGKKSYSYFIWHQVILAFWRCYVGAEFDVLSVLICTALIVAVSEASYYLVEKRLIPGKKLLIICVACAVVLSGVSGLVYLRAGVIRDVPELGISTDNIQSKMHGGYCDRIYSYDREFEDNQHPKVMVIGNSFARDWANILLESDYADKIDISYAFSYDDSYEDRLKESDCVFLYSQDETVYERLITVIDADKIWVVGTKNFGECNDMIYLRRFRADYFETTVRPTDESVQIDERMRNLYADRYIEMMKPLMNEQGEIHVFTEDRKFISQDCRHLTQDGAKYYAAILDLDRFLADVV